MWINEKSAALLLSCTQPILQKKKTDVVDLFRIGELRIFWQHNIQAFCLVGGIGALPFHV
jgi:hypothetical protein